ncbi:MAG: hypothetical protein KGY99_06845 [Phycisphaerae bacterium]|nr:hypothetical protein [Phycisphaerae bacterium]
MTAREVLGVDFTAERLLAVQLRRESAGPVITRCAAREVPPDADAATVGDVVRGLLSDEGFTASAAVFGIPAGRGFCRSADATPAPDAAHQVYDDGVDARGEPIRAVALRSDVDRLREIAAAAPVELQAVTLRALGCLRATRPADGGETGELTVVVGRDTVTLLLTDDGRLVAAHTRRRDASDGRVDGYVQTVGLVTRMVHLATTVHPEARGTAVRVVVNADDRPAAQRLPERLGVDVQQLACGRADGLSAATETPVAEAWSREAGDFTAAVGLALQALGPAAGEIGPTAAGRAAWRVNLLRKQGARPQRRLMTRRRVALAVAGVVIAALVALGTWAGVTSARLAALRDRRAALDERLAGDRQMLARWRHLRRWRPGAADGARVPLAERLATVGEAFPNGRAYAPSLRLTRREAGLSLRVDGRARPTAGEDPVYRFAERLNAAAGFQNAAPGAISEVSDPRGYTRTFSVTAETREP